MLSKTGIKVKKKMIQLFQRIVCLLFVLTTAYTVSAQAVDDIPLFFEEEDHYTPAPAITKPKPVVKPVQTQPVSKPISLTPNKNQPNIGRNAQPLTQVGMLPPPAPNILVNLPQANQNIPQQTKPAKPINTRIQAINLPSNKNIANNISFQPSGDIGQIEDVRGFELEGFYLGMTTDEVIQLANENRYKITSSKKAISKFRTSYYESLCKSRKIYLPADIRTCINQMSQQNDTTYLSELKISRPKTHEYMEFYFTSPATDNRLWKIVYQNKGDNSLNFTRANTQKKLNRKEAFLNAVYNKFGHPNNAEKFIWGNERDAYMQIGIYGSNYDAHITLVDVLLSDDDYFEAEDWLHENKPFERFGFED